MHASVLVKYANKNSRTSSNCYCHVYYSIVQIALNGPSDVCLMEKKLCRLEIYFTWDHNQVGLWVYNY